MININIDINQVRQIDVDIGQTRHITADMGQNVVIPAGDPYEGPYVVTPEIDNNVVLVTRSKYMSDNVTVNKIPYEEVSNPQGGKTATIGGL